MSLTVPNMALFGTAAAMALAVNCSVSPQQTPYQMAKSKCMNVYVFFVLVIGLIYTLLVAPSRFRAGSQMMRWYSVLIVVLYVLMISFNVSTIAVQLRAIKQGAMSLQHSKYIDIGQHGVILGALVGIIAMLIPSVLYTFKMAQRH